jgi:cytochrome c-type biogenesis protein CcmF
VSATILQEFVRGIQARRATNGEGPLTALYNLMRRNGQRYGGYLVHLGIVLMGVAIIGNGFYQSTTHVTLKQGESLTLAGYTFTYQGFDQARASNHTEFTTNVAVQTEGGRQLGVVEAKRNVYDKNQDMVTSEVGLLIRPSEDLYVVLNGWEGTGETATFTIFINPLTVWLWVGGLVLVIGTLFCIWPHPVRRVQPATVAGTAPGYAAGS